MTNKQKLFLRSVSYWLIFIFSAVALTLKILEVSAGESYKLISETPECAEYSRLVEVYR